MTEMHPPVGLPDTLAGPPNRTGMQPAAVLAYPVSFTGSAGEYFRLWIVNLALTIVTLGLYLPWARVRNRQYFYGHTWADGQNFEYTASPLALLRGYLIVVAFSGTYTLATNVQFTGWELVAGVVLVGFVALYPWLVMKSLRFLAVSTVHRGIRFRFHGQAGGAYLAYWVANLAAGLSSGLALPWAWYMQRRYQVENAAYGTARATFRGDVGPFFVIGLTGLGVTLGGGLLLLIPAGLLITLVLSGESSGLLNASPDALFLSLGIGYLAFLSLYAVAWQYVRAATMKYVLERIELGGVVRFGVKFSPWQLVWISVSNSVVQILTLGLATPWAAVRRARYLLGGIQVLAIASLDEFAADLSIAENALGEAATELLDINLGF